MIKGKLVHNPLSKLWAECASEFRLYFFLRCYMHLLYVL